MCSIMDKTVQIYQNRFYNYQNRTKKLFWHLQIAGKNLDYYPVRTGNNEPDYHILHYLNNRKGPLYWYSQRYHTFHNQLMYCFLNHQFE